MIDVVSGDLSHDRDWAQVWFESELRKSQIDELETLAVPRPLVEDRHDGDGYEYASSTVTQFKLVTKRASIQLWRDTEYVMNKVRVIAGPLTARLGLGRPRYFLPIRLLMQE